jgi:hypothetical protein
MYRPTKHVLNCYAQAEQAFTDILHNGEDAYFAAEDVFTDALEADIKQQCPEFTAEQIADQKEEAFDRMCFGPAYA